MRNLALKGYVKGSMFVKSFIKDEKGDIVQTSVIIGILAILAIVVLTTLKEPITNVFNKIKEGLESAL